MSSFRFVAICASALRTVGWLLAAVNQEDPGSEPASPETKAYIDNYTPSKESPRLQDFFGRRQLRIANGQDPVKQPEKRTPLPPVERMLWPTNDEAYKWAEPGRRKRAIFSLHIREEVEPLKMLKTPSGAAPGSTSSPPITEETVAAASTSYAGPALPIQL
jgi:hypothetical protein